MIEVGDGQSAARLKELHQAIDKLVLPPRRRKAEALLPHISGETSPVTEEEEEEDL